MVSRTTRRLHATALTLASLLVIVVFSRTSARANIPSAVGDETHALVIAGKYPAALTTARARLRAMRSAKDAAGEADAASQLADVWLLLGNDREADPLTTAAAAYDERHGRMLPLADALTLLARGALDRKEWRSAERRAARAVSIYDRFGDGSKVRAMPALGALNAADIALGRTEASSRLYLRGSTIFPRNRSSIEERYYVHRFLEDDFAEIAARRPRFIENVLRRSIARYPDANVAAQSDRYAELSAVELIGHETGAEHDARTALDLARRAFGRDTPITAFREQDLADAIGDGRSPEIRRLLAHARNVIEKQLGPNHWRAVRLRISFEFADFAAGDRRDALRTIESMRRSNPHGWANDDDRFAELCFGYGHYYRYVGDAARARTWFERAIATIRRAGADGNTDVGDAEFQIAKTEADAGSIAEAAVDVDRAIDTYAALGLRAGPLVDALAFRAGLFHAQNRIGAETHDRGLIVSYLAFAYGANDAQLVRPLASVITSADAEGESAQSILRWRLVVDAQGHRNGFMRPLPEDVLAVRAARNGNPIFGALPAGSLPFTIDANGDSTAELADVAGWFVANSVTGNHFVEAERIATALIAALSHDRSRGRDVALRNVIVGRAEAELRNGEPARALAEIDAQLALIRADRTLRTLPDAPLQSDVLYTGRSKVELLLGMFAAAEADARIAERLDARMGHPLGADKPLLNEGIAEQFLDRPFEARRSFRAAEAIDEPLIENVLLNGSETEASKYLSDDFLYGDILRFYVRFAGRNRVWAGEMYDTVLREKGLIARSSASVRRRFAASAGASGTSLLDLLRAARARYAAQALLEPADPREHAVWASHLEGLHEREIELQARLAARVGKLPNAGDIAFTRVSWPRVAATLARDEAAIEIVVAERPSEIPSLHGHVGYDALVLKNDGAPPQLVALGSVDTMADALDAYRQSIRRDATDRRTFAHTFATEFWAPLAPYLAGIKRIDLAPDGVLDEISFDAIELGDGRLAGDVTDIRVFASTADLIEPPRPPRGANASALVVGDPRYDLDEPAQLAALGGENIPPPPTAVVAEAGDLVREPPPRGHDLTQLDGTQREADDVTSVLRASGYTVREFTGARAQRTIFEREAPRARVLHVATHAFSLPTAGVDLTRQGLLFAGADRYWATGAESTTVDDGVLTALEATALDLTGTDLVVLSACGTGTGALSGSEGVFGLARAFREAGADATLVSLWDVPDDDTAVLMQNFYRIWLAGANKHEALREAEQIVRKDVIRDYGYDIPWRWAGFVLVGA